MTVWMEPPWGKEKKSCNCAVSSRCEDFKKFRQIWCTAFSLSVSSVLSFDEMIRFIHWPSGHLPKLVLKLQNYSSHTHITPTIQYPLLSRVLKSELHKWWTCGKLLIRLTNYSMYLQAIIANNISQLGLCIFSEWGFNAVFSLEITSGSNCLWSVLRCTCFCSLRGRDVLGGMSVFVMMDALHRHQEGLMSRVAKCVCVCPAFFNGVLWVKSCTHHPMLTDELNLFYVRSPMM